MMRIIKNVYKNVSSQLLGIIKSYSAIPVIISNGYMDYIYQELHGICFAG